ncbi:MAG: primosomal protein N' (replication factor Y), partial [Kiritimatiellia bacterium]
MTGLDNWRPARDGLIDGLHHAGQFLVAMLHLACMAMGRRVVVGLEQRLVILEFDLYVRVAIARPLRGLYSYSVPAHIGPLRRGHVVLVPFGSRSETGYVIDCTDESDYEPSKTKAVRRLLDPVPAFDDRQLDFFRWVADYYLCPLGPVIHTALPREIKAKTLVVLQPTDAGIEALAMHAAELSLPLGGEVKIGAGDQVLREVIRRPGLTARGMERRLDGELKPDQVKKAVDALLRKKWVEQCEREVNENKGMVKTVELLVSLDQLLELVPKAGRRMRSIVAALARHEGPMDRAQLRSDQGTTVSSTLKRLEDAGVLRSGTRERRDLLSNAPALGSSRPPQLNEDQLKALAVLMSDHVKGAYLLHGVTGSGKTEVFLGAARHALDRGKQVLVLVPEIGLTPQLVGRFRARFGDDVAVLHSGLTGGERLAQWRRIRAQEARVAVGARSALFAPFQNLGLVVIDEEHDDSYKQDDGVPYSARDLAVVLGRSHECAVVLASATPSMESFLNARRGRYGLLSLPKRATPAPVPVVELVDLTQLERLDGKMPVFAPDVVKALAETFERGGQAIVLYNRRGYATMVQCTSCGGTYECPSCGIAMTLHLQAGVVACHYCGYKRSYSDRCPACNNNTLDELGRGTERVEQSLAALFPDIAMARMDADTTAVRGAHERILTEFREGRTRLLIGTQIVAKGHDFPDVHTAVVVSADQGFRMPDFRAAERTFALLKQLAGRAGRGTVPGRVFVQTWKPDHHVLTRLDDPEAFYERELELRQMMYYPPYTRLCLVRL